MKALQIAVAMELIGFLCPFYADLGSELLMDALYPTGYADYTDFTTQPGVAIRVWKTELGVYEVRQDRESTLTLARRHYPSGSDECECWLAWIDRSRPPVPPTPAKVPPSSPSAAKLNPKNMMHLPKRYTYTMRQANPGRYCLLTRDCLALAAALGDTHHLQGSVQSDSERDPAQLAADAGIEAGVVIERRDNWQEAIDGAASLAEIYPGVSEERLRQMGFGGDLDAAEACRKALETAEAAPDKVA